MQLHGMNCITFFQQHPQIVGAVTFTVVLGAKLLWVDTIRVLDVEVQIAMSHRTAVAGVLVLHLHFALVPHRATSAVVELE